MRIVYSCNLRILKMILVVTCTIALFSLLFRTQIVGIQIPVDQTPLVATCSAATTVQVFSSLVFIDLISAHNPKVVFGLRLPSAIAVKRIYDENLRLYEGFGLRNAKDIASTVASAVAQVDVFTFPPYYLNTGIAVGEFLVDRGLLSCGNAIERATEYFGYEQAEFRLLDPTQLESYVDAIVKSLEYLLDALGYNLEEKEVNWQILADLFNKAYSKYES